VASSTISTAILARDLLETLSQLRRSTRRAVGKPWPAADLTGAQIELLRVVRRQPGVSVAAAAAELGVAANTVSTLVRQLRDAGLLKRDPDVRDRRIGRLALTEAARRRLDDWRDHRVAFVADALDRLEPAELGAVEAALPIFARLADRLGKNPA
jgi:DNA-binding MarR family transcriptional regulator